MTKHHAIRVAVGGLSDVRVRANRGSGRIPRGYNGLKSSKRQAAILTLLKNPGMIPYRVGVRLRYLTGLTPKV